jgi:hypothetical protein
VETTYRAFRRLKTKRRLPAVFDTLIAAEAGNHPVELSMVIVYVCLEMLKDTWARTEGIAYKEGYFWRPQPRTGKLVRFGFEAMLRSMLAKVGVRRGLRLLTRYRNALIHSGGLRLPQRTKSRAYVTAQRLCREYVLRLLGYKGTYAVWGSVKLGRM